MLTAIQCEQETHYFSLSQWTLKKNSLNFIFPTKYVIPKSLKFSHWPSKTFFSSELMGTNFCYKAAYFTAEELSVSDLDMQSYSNYLATTDGWLPRKTWVKTLQKGKQIIKPL